MYTTEHVPPRMALPEFVGGLRLTAADGQKPSLGGFFTVSDLAVVRSPAVAAIMESRSEREIRISNAVSIADRRVYKLDYDSHEAGFPLPAGKDTVFVLTVGVTSSDHGEIDRWYESEHLAMLRAVPGWLRSRRYTLIGGGATGYPEGKEIPKLLAVHEWTSAEALKTEEFKAATSTEWRTRAMATTTVVERRTFDVFQVLRK